MSSTSYLSTTLFRTASTASQVTSQATSRRGRRGPRPTALALFTVLVLGLSILPAMATEVGIFRTEGLASAVEGERDGVSVDVRGRLELSPRLEHIAGLDEPYVFAASASSTGGWVLGTGNEGKVFHVSSKGETELLGSLPEPEVFAVLGRADGSVVAGGSPGGRVYRLAQSGEGDDSPEEIFDAQATYIWALAEDTQGRLLVATGLPGQVWRVDGSGKGTLLWTSPDQHVRALLPRPDGSVLVGTAGQGLVVSLADGSARTLYDGAEPEVLAFAADGDRVYTALLASEASFVDLSASEDEGDSNETESVVEITVGSRSGGYAGPRSVIVALDAEGRVEPIAQLAEETVHALLFHDDALWVGTGQSGHLYRWVDSTLVREARLDELQLVGLVAARGGKGSSGDAGTFAVVTTNAGALYVAPGDRRASGKFTSQVLDTGDLAQFGLLHWRGHVPKGSSLSFSVRSGMASEPDATWTDWIDLPAAEGGDWRDQEIPLTLASPGRYVQWQAKFERGSNPVGPVLDTVELSYRQRNREPAITSFAVLPPGKILVDQSFNPSSTTFEPWSPNQDGIFTTLRKEKDSGQQKELYKHGYRTLQWEVDDPNDDPLVYRLVLVPERSVGSGPGARRGASDQAADGAQEYTMAEDLEETYYSFDSTVLPDGLYRFRLIASDEEANNPGEGLEASEISARVIVDHSPPRLVEHSNEGGTWEVLVEDALHPIANAKVSLDAGPWQPVKAADGLLDGRRERLVFEVDSGARLVLLRLTDGAHNVLTLNLTNR